MKHPGQQIKLIGASGATYFLDSTGGNPELPRAAGVYVLWCGDLPSRGTSLAGHTRCLRKVWSDVPLALRGLSWHVAYLEVSLPRDRERYAMDLEAGLAFGLNAA